MTRTRTARYFDIKPGTASQGTNVMEVYIDGLALLRMPMTNKGTAFTANERVALNLEGLLPPVINGLEEQVGRVILGYRDQPTDLAKYQYLRALQDRQELLFFAALERHLEEMLPIVYTPTVGDAIRKSHFLYQMPRGISLSRHDADHADAVIANYPWGDVRMVVATDASAILGIGDQGYGGLAISVGKLALYTAGGGVAPFHTLPALLDVGTTRTDLLEHPFYLGVREQRLTGKAYMDVLDKFVAAVKKRWPRAVIQWEDFSKDTAFDVLARYRKEICSFNDDIQGTGAMTLAGVLNACRLRNEKLKDQSVIVHGAGAGGIGVAKTIAQGMIGEGLTFAEAADRIFVLDSKGLLTSDRPMEEYKRPFAKSRDTLLKWPSGAVGSTPGLLETVREARATVLLGLSGQANAFDRDVILAASKNTARPVVFALSNPTSSAEVLPADALAWTDGAAILATGSPFAPVVHNGRSFVIGQGNNAFVFPGLGFGTILSEAREVTDGMVLEAAYALAEYTAKRHPDLVYPPVSELQEVSIHVATRVFVRAMEDKVAQAPALAPADVPAHVKARFWHAEYLPVVRG